MIGSSMLLGFSISSLPTLGSDKFEIVGK
jgi:hypothetical protein